MFYSTFAELSPVQRASVERVFGGGDVEVWEYHAAAGEDVVSGRRRLVCQACGVPCRGVRMCPACIVKQNGY